MHDEWGVAVQSFYPSVGSLVPGARAGAGVMVTQGIADPSTVPVALDALASGMDAGEVVEVLLRSTTDRDARQFGVVDSRGASASHTGTACAPESVAVALKNGLAIGNTAVPGAIAAMAEASGEHPGTPLADRLLASLRAGAAAGGDRRGELAATLKVVRRGGGFLGRNDVVVDLRVDADADPLAKLSVLMHWHRLCRTRAPRERLVPVAELSTEDERWLRRIVGVWLRHEPAPGPDGLMQALIALNVGDRIDTATKRIDSLLLEDLVFLDDQPSNSTQSEAGVSNR